MRLRVSLGLVLLAALAACGRADDAANRSDDPQGPGNITLVPEDEGGPIVAPTIKDAALDEMDGVKIGMTIADLRAAGFSVEKDDGPDPDNRCGYARIDGIRDRFFMLDGDTVVRIDVASPGHPTMGGVEVGMRETDVTARLGKNVRVVRARARGEAAHDFIVHRDGGAFGLVMETDGAKVLSYRIGRWEAVQSSDDCL
jgi:hypothetical protein